MVAVVEISWPDVEKSENALQQNPVLEQSTNNISPSSDSAIELVHENPSTDLLNMFDQSQMLTHEVELSNIFTMP